MVRAKDFVRTATSRTNQNPAVFQPEMTLKASRRFPAPILLLPLLLVAALVLAPAPRAEASSFNKPGMWIWYVSASEGGNLSQIIKRAKRSGIKTLYIKSGDGTGTWNQFNKRLVRRLHRANLKVCGWQYVYGRAPAREAKVSAAAKRRGADCFVIDAETQYEGNYSGADRYVRKLRARVGHKFPVSLSTFPYGHYHPAFPYSVFLGPGAASANQPQIYWAAIGDTVREAVGVTWLDNRLYKRPIYPLGQTYMNPRAKQLTAFRRYSLSYGTAPSWWSWQETNGSEWRTLARKVKPYKRYKPVRDKPVMQRGSRGDMVVWLQQHLNGARITVPVSGIFGRNTIRGVKKFQRQQRLVGDGIAGTQTWNRLLKVRPVRVRWSASRSRKLGARVSGRRPPAGPLSADLPAVRNEIAGAKAGPSARSR